MQRAVSGQREATREAILRCATSRIARGGIEGTTLQDVATAAGLSKGAVTHHFASKDDLLDAVVLRCAEGLAAELSASSAGADRLRALADAAMAAWSDDREEARVMTLVAAASLHDARLRAVCDGAWAALASVLSRALGEAGAVAGLRPRVPLESLARWLLGAAQGHRLARGDLGDEAARAALRMSLYACFEL